MNTELKTAAAYIRVSTDRQTELSPASQIKVIQDYAKQNGYIIPSEYIFRDDGISGRHAEKRPQFKEMIAVAKQKPAPFSAVLLWKFSRFARNQEESIFYKAMLQRNKIEVISVSEPLAEGPFGSLIERIIEWSDEYYSIRLSGEVKRGMKEKISRGEPVSKAPFGYVNSGQTLTIDESKAGIVRKIFNDYLNGATIRSISTNLNNQNIATNRSNSWDTYAVKYILRNPVYAGKIRWNTDGHTRYHYDDPNIVIVDGNHKPIIDNETFEKVQAMLDKQDLQHKKHIHKNITQPFMLHGLVKCSDCGATLVHISKKRGADIMQCCNYLHGKCNKSHYVSIEKLNDVVINAIEQHFKSDTFQLNVKSTTTQIVDNTELIKKDELKLKRVKAAYEDGVYTLEEYKQSRAIIENHIKQLRLSETLPQIDEDKLRKGFVTEKTKLLSIIKNSKDEAEKNELLSSFIDYIVFDKQERSIEIFFYT